MGNNEMVQLRQKVDEINTQLLHLLNERAKVVQEIGQLKKYKVQSGLIRYVNERSLI